MTKQDLRKKFGAIRRTIENREEKEAAALHSLKKFILDKPDVFCYVSMGSELSTHSFIREEFDKKIVLVPFTFGGTMYHKRLVNSEDLSTDKLGNVKESVLLDYTCSPSVIVVPMLAFNSENYRLGYGGGYYDRYLSNYSGLKIGLAFDEQESELPLEPFDMPLDIIITPSKIRERGL